MCVRACATLITNALYVPLNPQVAERVRGPGWRLDLYANTIAHERARAALKCFTAPALGGGGGGSGISSSGGAAGGVDAEADGRRWAGPGQPGEGLWRALAGCLTAGTSLEQAAAAPPAWLRGSPAAKERLAAAAKAARALARPGGGGGNGGGSNGGASGGGGGAALNASQAAAVEAALGRTLTLWQGPPGTGGCGLEPPCLPCA